MYRLLNTLQKALSAHLISVAAAAASVHVNESQLVCVHTHTYKLYSRIVSSMCSSHLNRTRFIHTISSLGLSSLFFLPFLPWLMQGALYQQRAHHVKPRGRPHLIRMTTAIEEELRLRMPSCDGGVCVSRAKIDGADGCAVQYRQCQFAIGTAGRKKRKIKLHWLNFCLCAGFVSSYFHLWMQKRRFSVLTLMVPSLLSLSFLSLWPKVKFDKGRTAWMEGLSWLLTFQDSNDDSNQRTTSFANASLWWWHLCEQSKDRWRWQPYSAVQTVSICNKGRQTKE